MLFRSDYGADFSQGVIGKVLPEMTKRAYPVYVPQVDVDGNEIAGLRVPEQAIPVATSMGWGVRSAASGTPGELCYLDGSYVPFPKGATQRIEFRDPRKSLAERYSTSENYVSRVKAHGEKLSREGYMLEEDLERVTRKAASVRW